MTQNRPICSVIITCYNYDRYVGKAIESVLNQSSDEVECLVVDDGSTDKSAEVILSYEGIVPIILENGGQVAAVKTAMDRAQGDIIIILDADDYLYENAVELVIANFKPSYSLLQFKLDIVNIQGNKTGELPRLPFISKDHREYVQQFGFFPSSPTSGNAFSSAHVRKMLGSMDHEKSYYVDGYLLYSAPFFGDIGHMEKCLGAYRVHGANVSLSSGLNYRTAKNDVLNAIWQRTAISRCVGEIMTTRTRLKYLSPYHLRNALLLKCGYKNVPELDFASRIELFQLCVVKFLTFPHLTVYQRVKNIVVIVFSLLAPRHTARFLIPE